MAHSRIPTALGPTAGMGWMDSATPSFATSRMGLGSMTELVLENRQPQNPLQFVFERSIAAERRERRDQLQADPDKFAGS